MLVYLVQILPLFGNKKRVGPFYFHHLFVLLFFFFGDDKPNLSYTKGKGAGLRRPRNKPEGTEPPPDQPDAQHTRMNFLETSH